MKEFFKLYEKCKKTDTNFINAVILYIWYRFKKKEILLHQRAIVKGSKNIQTNGLLQVGTGSIGFTHKRDTTYLNVNGKLIFEGPYTIGRGCRLDIGEDATVKIGIGGFINPFTKILIFHGLEIGNHCLISWDCQFLDDDFHEIAYEGKKEIMSNNIIISDNVWIGCGVSVLKGTRIGRGSAIAAHSVVRGIFEEENVIIAGNPARIIKRNISWQ